MSKIVIDVDDEFHKKLRIAAIEKGKTMKDYIIDSVLHFMQDNNESVDVFDFKKDLEKSFNENSSILEELKKINI